MQQVLYQKRTKCGIAQDDDESCPFLVVLTKVTELVLFNDLGWCHTLLGTDFDRLGRVGRLLTPVLCCVRILPGT